MNFCVWLVVVEFEYLLLRRRGSEIVVVLSVEENEKERRKKKEKEKEKRKVFFLENHFLYLCAVLYGNG